MAQCHGFGSRAGSRIRGRRDCMGADEHGTSRDIHAAFLCVLDPQLTLVYQFLVGHPQPDTLHAFGWRTNYGIAGLSLLATPSRHQSSLDLHPLVRSRCTYRGSTAATIPHDHVRHPVRPTRHGP